jgi:dTDP-4-amino-4,6-dideoxygalactose transaminase
VILMNDFASEPRELRDAMLAGVERVLASGWFILGKEVEEFERRWADACGVRHCIGVGNGLDAIEIALRALHLGPGDEVITTAMTAFASVLAIIRAGATPVLADIDPTSALLDPASVERCVTPRTRALVLVHLYGQMRAMDRWTALCRTHSIALVEDCAQSHLATWRGRKSGSFGRVGAYSFYPTKNLGAPGDAGALVTDDADIAALAKKLRNYGQSERYYHPELGMNSRLDELHAAILLARMTWLDSFTARRLEIARTLRTQISNPVIRLLAAPEEDDSHVYHLFVVRTPRRDALQQHLKAQGIQTLIHYPLPIHHQDSCRDIARDPQGLADAEAHAAECVSLPCHPQLSDADVARIVAAVNSF